MRKPTKAEAGEFYKDRSIQYARDLEEILKAVFTIYMSSPVTAEEIISAIYDASFNTKITKDPS
jgi:hypothetical protein